MQDDCLMDRGSSASRTVVSGGCVVHTIGVNAWTASGAALCPDVLDYRAIGAADNWRGRVVRVFFWLMRAWPA